VTSHCASSRAHEEEEKKKRLGEEEQRKKYSEGESVDMTPALPLFEKK